MHYPSITIHELDHLLINPHKKVAILQSNYIPWKGYFDIIAAVDEFILYDTVQFTKNDWRNRNKIKTPNGIRWISVPVGQDIRRRICDVTLQNDKWQEKHWKMLESNYRRALHFSEIASAIEPLYRHHKYSSLSVLNREFIEIVCRILGIKTKISSAFDYNLIDGKTERLVDLCLQAGATEYISGPAARGYVDERMFSDRNIGITWFEYSGYPEYPQLWGKFSHDVTILDLLFNCGNNSPQYMKYVCP
jgi:hypothetical protein